MKPIMIIAEHWGKKEEAKGVDVAGSSFWLLKTALDQLGIDLRDCHLTTVFRERPRPHGNIRDFYCPKKESTMPAFSGKYFAPKYNHHIDRLREEILKQQPNVIITMGPAAAWALLQQGGVKAIRGAVAASNLVGNKSVPTLKVIPTYSPRTVMADWSLRPIFLADLHKAKNQSAFPEIRRPSRKIWIEPTLDDLQIFDERYMQKATRSSNDIETMADQITCVGFAPTQDIALVVPFYDASQSDHNYWGSLADELKAWSYVRKWCETLPATYQNGLYDIAFLWRAYGIKCPKADHDTMLMHHAHQIEMQKGLGFLATLYTDEASWKFMSKIGTIKKGN